MKNKRSGPALGLWDAAALVLAGMMYLAVLVVFLLLLLGAGLWTIALEAGMFIGVLLLLGIGLYIFAKGRGIGKLARRLLLGALWAGGGMLLVFCGAMAVLLLLGVGGL